MWKVRLCLAIGALAVYCQSSALAQPPCMPAEAGLALMQGEYGESPLFEGQTTAGQRMVLTWNAETGTWSLLAGHPAMPGALCLVGNGDGGKPYTAPTAPPKGQPS